MLWRLPFGGGSASWPPIPPEARAKFPALGERFGDLDRLLVPAFERHDEKALVAQRSHRRFQLALTVGAGFTAFFGALQAALGEAVWTGIVVSVLGFATSSVSNQQRRVRPLASYLTQRAKAEELRSLYFRYLSGVEGMDPRALEAQVATIEHPKGTEQAR